jgi:molybdopterin/thiamine biosynthesis adenylyltransferase
MNHKRVVVIGLGGIGSQLIPSLLHFLHSKKFDGPVVLMDGDLYEEKNLNRQLVPEDGLGMNKAEAMAVTFGQRLPTLNFQSLPFYLDETNSDIVIEDDDFVICGVDNHWTRRMIDERIKALKNVTYISGGNDLTDGNMQVVRRRNGKALDPSLQEVHPEIAEAIEKPDWTPGCDQMVNAAPQIIVTNLMVASAMLNAVWAIWEDKELSYSEVYVDVEVNAARSTSRKDDEPQMVVI